MRLTGYASTIGDQTTIGRFAMPPEPPAGKGARTASASTESQEMSRTARFRMAGPGDLFKKLRYNIKLVGAAPTRAAAAWATLDAAVTAWCLPDWCYETFRARGRRIKLETVQGRMIAAAPGLEACRMIATAYKHFEVTRRSQ